MGRIDNPSMEDQLKQANTLMVGPPGSGFRYTTIQAAVDAAVADVVFVMPGVSRIYTPAAGILVVFLEDMIDLLPGYLNEPPLYVHTPAAFVLRQDDGSNVGATATTLSGWWHTANAALPDTVLFGGANSTPFDYLRRRGIVLTCAIPSDYLGASNRLTANQAAMHIRDGGWEIACHTKNHTTVPATDAERIAAVVTSKAAIEAALLAATPSLTYTIQSFVAVGDWASSALDMATAAEEVTALGHLVRQYYQGSQWFNSIGPSGGASAQHFDNVQSAIVVATEAAQSALAIEKARAPGVVSTILIHTIKDAGASGSEMSTAQFKTLIDGLYADMVSGKTTCLTLSGARRCVLGPIANPGGVMYGNLDVAAKPADSTYLNSSAAFALEAEAVDANALHTWAGVNHLVYDGTAGYGDITFRVSPKIGRHYTILFDFRTRAAAAEQAFTAQLGYGSDRLTGANAATSESITFNPPGDDSWQQGSVPFYMDDAYRIVRTYLSATWTGTKGIKAGNFRLVEVG